VLDWHEVGGPRARAPTRRGFGSRVIEREVRAGLHGEITLDFGAEGLRARISFPLEACREEARAEEPGGTPLP
jgi:two-component sensor histidine kinase